VRCGGDESVEMTLLLAKTAFAFAFEDLFDSTLQWMLTPLLLPFFLQPLRCSSAEHVELDWNASE